MDDDDKEEINIVLGQTLTKFFFNFPQKHTHRRRINDKKEEGEDY